MDKEYDESRIAIINNWLYNDGWYDYMGGNIPNQHWSHKEAYKHGWNDAHKKIFGLDKKPEYV